MIPDRILQTGQRTCYNEEGDRVDCRGSGQDGEYQKGVPWPDPRFRNNGAIVQDLLTGLCWTTDANPAKFPISWHECFDFIRSMNRRGAFGYADWRLPNRNELRSLVSYATKRPALPEGHPFVNVFNGWYWTSTSAAINPAYAWYVHMDGARMFYGGKQQYYMLWPVRGTAGILPRTGQLECFDNSGGAADCSRDGKNRGDVSGAKWPEPRFVREKESVLDRLTGLRWLSKADLAEKPVSWSDALRLVAGMSPATGRPENSWRLPNINELESLVDCSRHSPALQAGHPFIDVRDVYWSSTTSFFEPDWAWALYLNKGALGVGFKKKPEFYIWPVREG